MPVNDNGMLKASTIINELSLTGKQNFNKLQNLAFSTPLKTLTKQSMFYFYNNNFKPASSASQIIYNTGYSYIFKATTQYNLTTTANYTDFTITINNQVVEVLLVAGGGGGGTSLGSGGGAGGLVYVPESANLILNGTYKIRVGSGGLNMQSSTDTTTINGTDSTIFDSSNNVILRAIGGAMGNGQSTAYTGTANRTGAGNAAGGCRWMPTPAASAQNTGTTGLSITYGYCNNAGTGNNAGAYGSGGGGGAGGVGANADNGTGGAAFSCPITGTTTYYAAGGGGSTNGGGNPTGGYGGAIMLGGQGNGNGNGGDALNDTGSGGGGGGGVGGRGSAGICIIKLFFNLKPPTVVSNGVTITSFSYISSTNTYYYIFTSTTGTNTITFPSNFDCQVLIVGGGGGGGGGFGGSGGAGGGVYYNSKYTFNAGTYTIVVGAGGGGGSGYNSGTYGSGGAAGSQSIIQFNSTSILTANGGGGSDTAITYSYSSYHAANGGSTSANINGVVTNYSGGNGYFDGSYLRWVSGGGAGAGQNGISGSMSGSTLLSYGNGGNGYSSFITGTAIYYAGGGAGAPAAGGVTTPDAGINGLGQNNYGGGGRGYSNNNTNGQNGAAGCVIIAFLLNILYSFTTITFTNAGATGSYGPNLSNAFIAYSSYSWITNVNFFNMYYGLQYWTVPKTGTYTIIIAGAGEQYGQTGYIISMSASLTIGQILTLIVGQKGFNGNGGGGSFIFNGKTINTVSNLLICAGGAGANGSSGGANASIGNGGGSGNGCNGADGGGGGAINTNGSNGGDGVDIGQGSSQYIAGAKGGVGGSAGSSWNNASLYGSSVGSFGGGGLKGANGANGWYGYGGQGGFGGGGGGGGCWGGGGVGGGGGGGSSYSINTSTYVGTNANDGYITITAN